MWPVRRTDLKDFLNKRKFLVFGLLAPFVLLLVLNAVFPLPREGLEQDFSTVWLDRKGGLMHLSLSPSGQYRINLPLARISPYLKKGFVRHEDRFFWWHPGVDPFAVVRAVRLNLAHGRTVSGASTITMQLARMMESRPRRLGPKIIETLRAFQLEWFYGKKKILETYLNSVPMGGNIEGVGAAAWLYFGKNADRLSPAEAALLIGIPNAPNLNRPDRFPGKAREEMMKVLSRSGRRMGLSSADLTAVQPGRILAQRAAHPYRCPHLIEEGKYPPDRYLRRMTIDPDVQASCEKILKDASLRNGPEGIYNGAVIVVDNRTMEVLAYVGSPDYFDHRHGGQINGCAISRSPGSALKPFLYGRALEAGSLTPEKAVFDVPREFGDFNPANFHRTSCGIVTAKYSLINSLNIPAVRLEYELGPKGLAGLLRSIYPADRDLKIEQAGLSVALGGFCLSLEELTALYAGLANNGLRRNLKFFLDDRSGENPRRIVDPRACYIVSEILSGYDRPDLPYNWDFTSYLAKAALKTGTSFGLRDAWCLGYNPDYTIGVWIGNADYRGASTLTGIKKAAPVFIRIFDLLTKNSDQWYARPAGVGRRDVCSVSGEKAGVLCPSTKEDLYIPGVSSEQTCRVHRTVFVRKSNHRSVCAWCMTGDHGQYQENVIEHWPPDVVSFLRSTGKAYTPVPPHDPACDYFSRIDRPQIIKPAKESVYELNDRVPPDQQKIALQAWVAQDAETVYWFSGTEFITEGKPDETCFISPRRGQWTISAIDSKGRSDSVTIRVY